MQALGTLKRRLKRKAPLLRLLYDGIPEPNPRISIQSRASSALSDISGEKLSAS